LYLFFLANSTPSKKMAGGGNGTGGALPHDAAVALYLALTLILLVARILGEIAKKLNQPPVMGELLAGVLLGKTCLYYISPSFFNYLFAPNTKNASALAGVTSICVTMYMLIAGLEMNLRNALKKKQASISVGFFALAVPFLLGFLFCYYFPQAFGLPPGKNVTNFALFTATAMAITALPVVAKTLRDLHLFRTELGIVVMSASVFDDILGWSLFAVTLAVSAGGDSSNGLSLAAGIAISIIYVIFVLTIGTFATNRLFPYIQAYFSFPAGELGFICLFALASSTFALWIGLHNTLGAFIAGAAIGNSRHFRAEMRETLDTFVSFMLAPIFFGSVCISANFVTDFSADVVFSIFFLSCAGKLIGGFIGAKLAKSGTRDSIAVAVCMNSRGAMELILAQVALDAGIIDGKVFVALVFMAIVTSVMPGPILRKILNRPSTTSVSSILPSNGFIPKMTATTMQEAIKDLATVLKHPELSGPAIEKELAKSDPIWDGLSVASVVSKNLKKPLAALGIFPKGLLYGRSENSADEPPITKFMVLLLIPESQHTIEFDLMREVSQLFASQKFQDELLGVESHVQLQALFQIEKFRQGMAGHNPNPTPVIAVKETGMIAVDVDEIINGSPRASPSTPNVMLSPRALGTLHPYSLDSGVPEADKSDESFAELVRRKPLRRETSKSLRATIEEYVTSPPGGMENPEPSDVIRRLSALREGGHHHHHQESTSDEQSVPLSGIEMTPDVEQGMPSSTAPRQRLSDASGGFRSPGDDGPRIGDVSPRSESAQPRPSQDGKTDDNNHLGLI
jgi:Kef-type K+ transport system membrane component KefB